jgi:hypothetical protein
MNIIGINLLLFYLINILEFLSNFKIKIDQFLKKKIRFDLNTKIFIS